MSDIRSLIRELLVEELARVKTGSTPRSGEELVRIESDSDLAAFARRVLQIAASPQGAEDIRKGRVTFRLQNDSANTSSAGSGSLTPAGAAQSGRMEIIDKKLITERDITNLPEGAGVVSIGRQSRVTPLAKDELRRRGIQIQRKAS